MSHRVLVTGATGYVGGRLVPELLEAGHEVVCLARSPAKLEARVWVDHVEVVRGDVADEDAVAAAMEGCSDAYYMVHSMDGEGNFAERDQAYARSFRRAAERAGLRRIVYLGGLGNADADALSAHLRSRHEVGRELAAGPVAVDELRAAMVIGSGSASFEMLRHLVEVLPVMTTPKWVENHCQPIAIRDVLAYLVEVLDVEPDGHRVLEVGGDDVFTYRELMDLYASVAGLRRRVIIPVPVLSPRLSSLWIGLVTPLPTGLAKPLVHSLINEVVADRTVVDRLMPRETLPVAEAIRLALRRVQDLAVPSSWTDAELGRPTLVARRQREEEVTGRTIYDNASPVSTAEPQPYDPPWAGGVIQQDVQVVEVDAPPAAVYRSFTGIGGDRGWLTADFLWEVRGFLDVVVGGVGTRRGRRHPDELMLGDALDFWRVEALEQDRRMLLRAEMRVPGDAWLEFSVVPTGPGRSRLEQRARFRPRGLFGRAYWWSMVPFHAVIFPQMAKRVAERAEHLSTVTPMAPADTDAA